MKILINIILSTIFFSIIIFIVSTAYLYNILKTVEQVELVNETINESIPFYYSSTNHIVIDVKINGSKKKYPFILDSGANTMVFDNLLKEQNLPDIGDSFSIGAGGGFLFPDIYQVNHLDIGNIKFKNINVESINKLPLVCLENIYGILGKEAMRHLIWQINFEKKEITIVSEKKQLTFNENATFIPVKENRYGHQLYVRTEINLDSQKLDLIIDLGNSGYATVNLKKIEFSKGRRIGMLGNPHVGLDGANKSKSITQEIKDFRIGDITLPHFSISGNDVPISMLGLGFFKNYRTTISWKDRELILEPYKNQSFGRKGFSYSARFDEKENALLVKAVYKGLQADSLGIQPGDKILSLNGQIMDDASKYCSFDYKGIDKLTLELEQNGTTRKVTLEKRDYFPNQQPTEQVSMK